MRNRWVRAAMGAAVLLFVAAAGWGMFINNSVKLPVERVVKNVEAWIKEKPGDAQAYYVLGRIHAMAWAYGPELSLWGAPGAGRGGKGGYATEVPEGTDPFAGGLPGFAPYDSVEVQRDRKRTKVTAEDVAHLQAAIEAYQKSVELDPNKSLYELGLGWLLQEAGKAVRELPAGFLGEKAATVTAAEKAAYTAAIGKLGDTDAKTRDDAQKLLVEAMPKPLAQLRAADTNDAEVAVRVKRIMQGYWDLKSLEHYRKAYALDLQKDLGGRASPSADSQIAGEAGEAIVRILAEHPQAAKGNEAAEVLANVRTIQSKAGPITPVIFAMPGAKEVNPGQVNELVDAGKRVVFDLAGDKVARKWPWVKDGTAILVWDPMKTGKIESGRALFGSRTWWVFFRDGYEALGVLDDNRDGQLRGAEMEGIAVWVDKNGNGISEAGEVMSCDEAGIVALGCRASKEADGVLTVERGVEFGDGKRARTFDWVTEPHTDLGSDSPR